MPTVTDVIIEVQGTYMNDPSGTIYTSAKLLPHLKSAYGFLQTALEKNSIPCKYESVLKSIAAGVTEYTPLPNNLVFPISMAERLDESSDEFIPMVQEEFEDAVTQGATLNRWSWRLDRIFFTGATTAREVRLRYHKAFPAVNAASDELFGKASQYLAAKTASLAHTFIAQNFKLSGEANAIAESELDEIISIQVGKKQAMPVRRKPYRPFKVGVG